jgi:hypothetical protein
MADGVHHSRIGEDLNLNREDLGLDRSRYTEDQIVEIWEQITQPVRDRDRELLLCVARAHGQQCKAEQSGVKSPHMTVRKQRRPDGALRWCAAHLPTPHAVTREESDKHKATKEFLVRICEDAGLSYDVEKATSTRTRRPDFTVYEKGGENLGCEAQFYNASADNVRTRSRNHAEAGLVANWITDNDTFHLIDRANWMLMRPLPWHQIAAAADLPLMGGFRVLVEWRCTASAERPCPDGRVKTGCGNTHLEWDTPRRLDGEATGYSGDKLGVTVGRTVVGAATGEIESLFIPSRSDRRAGAYLWVPAQDKAKWADYEDVTATPDLEAPDPEEEVAFSREEITESCTYGETTFDPARLASAPLKRRGLASLSRTIAGPAATPSVSPRELERPQPSPAEASRCTGCGRPATHRTLSGVQKHYPGCPRLHPERAA